MERDRHCARPGCGAPASAALTYHYASRTAWVDDVSDHPEPSIYGLCGAHADGLTVPRGWNKEDRRSPARLPFPSSIAV